MYNLPKCKTCVFYETNTGDLEEYTAHCCRSPKHEWTDVDIEEWEKENPNPTMFTLRNVIPPFIVDRHCDYTEGSGIGMGTNPRIIQYC
ncbi:hypothetical protein LCGC14_1741280 [marine sediment metagenome]|uniref:Uncharacterized protein n=1 Tax=marine sediment metagenome TaxID=412755 RepID=A0A0F9HU70_9ZZZZ